MAAIAEPSRRRGLIAAIACVAVFSASSTLTFPLIAVLLERAGESGGRIGVNTAAQAMGMLVFTQIAPRIMARIGVSPFLAICLIVTASTLALLKLIPDYWTWTVLRLALGAATGGIFLATEFWIAAVSPQATRGRIAAAYGVSLSLGYMLGPSVLALVGPDGWAPFLSAIGLCAVAAIPLALAWWDAPDAGGETAPGPWRFFLSAPAAVWGVLLFGIIEFGAMTLVPVWGVRLGFAEAAAIALAVAIAAGNLLFQPAIGWAADRYAVRPLLLLCAATVVAVAALMPAAGQNYAASWALFFVWGGMAAGLYTIALTAVGARYTGSELAGANAALVTAYALGALVGPPAVGGAMDLMGPHGLGAVIGGLSAVYCILVIRRLRA